MQGAGPAEGSLDLTVVVPAVDAERSLGACLRAVVTSCRGLRAEILVVGPEDMAPAARAAGPTAVFLPAPPGSLVPELWATGIEQARGRVVALTTSYAAVTPAWARALIRPFAGSISGVGGPLELATGSGLVDWAIFYLRYSPYLSSEWPDGPVREEIAGDNAAYLLADLRRHASALRQGFWEFEFHQLLRAEGRTLWAAHAARADFGPSYRLSTFLRHRFRHGRLFAQTRLQQGTRSRLALVAGAPIVPLLLAWRAARRVGGDRRHVVRFAASLPLFLLMAGTWAAGEASGALAGSAKRVGPVVTSPRSVK